MRVQIIVAMAVTAMSLAPVGSAAEPAKGFDLTALDKTVDPCNDFFQYACGGWMKANPIPGDQSAWGRWDELIQANNLVLRGILEKASAPSATRTPVDQKIGDYYAACMDEKGLDAKGKAPLEPELARIAALKTKAELPELIGRQHVVGLGSLFSFSADQDFKDATQVIAIADQGGLGLPDRDYYLKDDAKSVELRQKYVAHVQAMLERAGDTPAVAAAGAKTVMTIETALAKASLDLVSRREPLNIYHKQTLAELQKPTPSFAWDKYLSAVGAPPVAALNVATPDFFKGLEAQLAKTSLDDWKTYLRWQVVHGASPYLASTFVLANFDFYGKTLQGQAEMRPRWKRCVQYTDDDLGEALGRVFVEKTFGADGKERMARMVLALRKGLDKDIRELAWMSEVTRRKALAKLEAVATKIGAPDKYRDYATLEIKRDDLLGNGFRGNAFEWKRQLAKIGRPVDRAEWQMTPPTVNAYYNPLLNDINFPVGILQPPFFDRTADDASNFGAIGAVIGHELSHGFDDQGRQFAANGNLEDWWTDADGKEFEKRAECFVDQYSGYTAVGDVKLNGQLVLGENVADNGGLRIALYAFQDTLAGKPATPVAGFTPEQRFFIGFGQSWCETRRDEYSRMLAQVDVHSPGRFRTNGTVANMPEFAKAFGCKAGAPMARAEKACRVW